MEKTQRTRKKHRREKPEAITPLGNLFVQRHCVCLMQLSGSLLFCIIFLLLLFILTYCFGKLHNRISNYFRILFLKNTVYVFLSSAV